MYSLIQKGRRLNLPTDIMLKLFDSCVEPILLYGCEVWGYENVDILEKVHTKFCKFIFGISKYSHNMPVYGELGRYPLSIKIKQRMVRYWTRILKSNEYKLNKVMYTISDTPQFRGGNPYFFSENPYQSVSFIYAWIYRENDHAIHIAMQFASKSRHCVIKIVSQQQSKNIGALLHVAGQSGLGRL